GGDRRERPAAAAVGLRPRQVRRSRAGAIDADVGRAVVVLSGRGDSGVHQPVADVAERRSFPYGGARGAGCFDGPAARVQPSFTG
ncbi:unnamed protein product, partial [Ectocarpus sp. 8 AP-2014]